MKITTESDHSRVLRERRNVFSDKTNLYLLQHLRGKSALPDTLGPDTLGDAAVVSHNVPRDLQLELAVAIRQRLLPWLGSFLIHAFLLILLAVKLLPVLRYEQIDALTGGLVNIPFAKDALLNAPPGGGEGNAPSIDNAEIGTPNVADENTIPQNTPVSFNSPGLNLSGRDPDLRSTMLGGGGGGGGGTDEAVLAGLRWLVKVQQPNGAWHFSGKFPQSASKRLEDNLAATAMALIAFQGYGVTPKANHQQLIEFAQPVWRGWEWLLRQQNPDGSFVSPSAKPNNHFYTHSFCTIALCELLAMTGDEKNLREPAQRAIDYCVRHQSLRCGGWRYLPDRYSEQSDVSVTGWIVLALKSGQSAGLTVPQETYNQVMTFLDSMMKGDQYRYREEELEAKISMTAEALYCRILMGWKRDDPRLAAGIKLILDTPPSFAEHYRRDVYYWFFASQTLYHYGGNEWQTWNSQMREQLLQHQEKSGAESGSWHPERPARDAWKDYGRLYTTCMSLYILEVYYRHQRIFPEGSQSPASEDVGTCPFSNDFPK